MASGSQLPFVSRPALEWMRPLLSWDLLCAVPHLYRAGRQLLARYEQRGLYEILDFDSTLELLDSHGRCARFRKHQRVRFLQDSVIAFQDYAWGEGQLFASYSCAPGVVVDRYQEGDRWNILISLRETRNRGDVTDFHIERTVRNGFTKQEEWNQVELRHPTQRLRMAVCFPADRPCRRAIVQERSRHRSTPLGPECFHTLPNGQQMVVWETRNIRRFEIFTLRWWW